MDIANLTVIKSSDVQIKVADKAVEQAPEQTKQQTTQTPIDDKFVDKASISTAKEIPATVLAKLENGKTLLELNNGKQIEVKLPVDLKVMDKIVLQLNNSQITNVVVKDIAQSLNLNSAALIKLVSNLQQQNLSQNTLPLTINTDTALPRPEISLPLANSILKLIPIADKSAPIIQQSNTPQVNLSNQSIEFSINNKPAELPVAKFEFPQPSIKLLVDALQSNFSNNNAKPFEAKVVQQVNPQQVNVAFNKNLSAEVTLTKPETILNSSITLKPIVNQQGTNLLVKADTNNPVQTIKLTTENFKQIVEPLKLQATTPTNTTSQTFTANIKDNVASLPALNNISFKLPIKLEQITNQPINQGQVNINKNTNELTLKVNDTLVKLNTVDLMLDNKSIAPIVTTSLQNSTIISNTSNTITLKTSDLFELLLNIKNNLSDIKTGQFNLTADNKIALSYPEKTVENPILQTNQAINKQAIPNLAQEFAPQLTFMMATAIIANKQAAQSEEKADIFSLLLDTLPEQYKPRLQASSQQNEGWKFFSFPYYQEEDQPKNGEALYSNKKDKDGNSQTNLAIKVNFSKIGDVMLKFKVLNKNVNLNIYTQIDIKPEEKQKLIELSHQIIEKSGFFGTVAVKKQKTIEIPLSNSQEIGYSGINIKI